MMAFRVALLAVTHSILHYYAADFRFIPGLSVELDSNASVIQELETVSLSCFFFTGRSANPKIVWKKDGRPIKIDQQRISLVGTNIIRISSARVSDSGQYTCSVTVKDTGKLETTSNPVEIKPLLHLNLLQIT
eukprot:m.148089 g.148089  ORF g.148089 m.148089 type:complete len:133 (+) comp38490_c1_seq3:1402-1800(+)